MPETDKKFQLWLKYAFDKLMAIFALLITAPIFLVVALILKFQGEDVFFLQKRLGKGGNEFWVYKFTTMPKGSEKLGLITTTNDPRPTKFGKFLRKTKLNELPQLINVLKGDMSIVGPRPIIKSQMLEGLTEEEIKEYYQMRPGITGYASLFFHHEDRLLAQVQDPSTFYNEVLLPRKKELEVEYAQNWSLWLDFKILFLTAYQLIKDALGLGKDVPPDLLDPQKETPIVK